MNKLRNIIPGIIASTLCLWSVFSCADNSNKTSNEVDVIASLEQWIINNKSVEYLNETKVADGLYMKIYPNVGNDPAYDSKSTPNDSSYVYINYIAEYLDGSITTNTYEKKAEELGQISRRMRYVPFMFRLDNFSSYPGLTYGHVMALKKMHIGDSVEMYLAPNYGYYYSLDYSKIFFGYRGDKSITVKPVKISMKLENFKDGKNIGYQANADLEKYSVDNSMIFTETGVYMKWLSKNDNVADSIRSDTTIYLNYVGKFIPTAQYPNFAFDTNILDTAYNHNFNYNDDSFKESAYKPLSYSYNKNDTTSYGNLIKPFKSVIGKMKLGEKVQFITTYEKAYGIKGMYNTNGTIIFPYTPLIFEFEVIKKEPETED